MSEARRPDTDIQIVSKEAGETAYLLKSETMKQRLVAAAQRQEGLSLDAVLEKLGVCEASGK